MRTQVTISVSYGDKQYFTSTAFFYIFEIGIVLYWFDIMSRWQISDTKLGEKYRN